MLQLYWMILISQFIFDGNQDAVLVCVHTVAKVCQSRVLFACEQFTWSRVWVGSLAAVSIRLGRPTFLAIGCLGVGNIALPLFLDPTNSNPSALRVACGASALRIRAVAAKSWARLALIASMYFWKVRHSLFCHARCESSAVYARHSLSYTLSFGESLRTPRTAPASRMLTAYGPIVGN